MSGLRRWLLRLRASLLARQDDERVREELEHHVALQAADNRRAGASPADAERQARLRLGSRRGRRFRRDRSTR